MAVQPAGSMAQKEDESMLGKLLVTGGLAVGAVKAYQKLDGMDATEIGEVGTKVAGVVDGLAVKAVDKARNSEIIQEIAEKLQATSAGRVVTEALDKFADGIGSGAAGTGIARVFDAMAAAKAQAEAGDGTFAGNMFDAAKDGVMQGLQSAISTGGDFVAEKLSDGQPAGTEASDGYDYEDEGSYGDVDYEPC